MNNNHDLILRPLLTEKNNNFAEDGRYGFEVLRRANKVQIKKALEKILNIKISKVNILNTHAKQKVFKGKKGVRRSFKKVYITTFGKKKNRYNKRSLIK